MHEGRPVLRETRDRSMMLVLCPYGHVIHGLPMREWAGSWLEAKANDPTWRVRCHGTLPRARTGKDGGDAT